jgi:hypothetical protein
LREKVWHLQLEVHMRVTILGLVLACSVGASHGGAQEQDPDADAVDSGAPLVDYFLVADEVFARRGETVDIRVFLSAPEPSRVVATFHDLTFDRQTPIAVNERMAADCMINPDIERPSGFAFQPFGCDPHRACTFLRVLFLGVDEAAIPDRTPLYTCRVTISPGARLGWHPLRVRNVHLYDAAGGEVPVRSVDGGISVVEDGMGVGASDTDGCQMGSGPSPSSGGVAWLLGALAAFGAGGRIRARVRKR